MDGFIYEGYSPHDGAQYRCKKCGTIYSSYALTNLKECPHCKESKKYKFVLHATDGTTVEVCESDDFCDLVNTVLELYNKQDDLQNDHHEQQ